MSINIHFTDEDWQRIERDWTSWWNHDIDRPMVIIYDEKPTGDIEPYNVFSEFIPNLLKDISLDEIIDRYQYGLETKRFYGDAWPKWWPNFGPGIMSAFLGSKVYSNPNTVWFEPSGQISPEKLQINYDSHNIWWQKVKKLTALAVERWGSNVNIGHTDIGGNLDILASLRGTEALLMDLCDVPDKIECLTGEITRLWIRYYDELDTIIRKTGKGTTPWAPIWSPKRCYMLQCDFSYMISPQMFERFVLPDLAACCEIMDHAFYHLDGKGQIPHLDMLLSLPKMCGIQWVPGDGAPPPEKWLPLLKRIRDAGKLCQLYISAESARTIVSQLGGRGFAFEISQKMSRDEAENFLNVLAAEDAGI